jgi:hypothetical protein
VHRVCLVDDDAVECIGLPHLLARRFDAQRELLRRLCLTSGKTML